MAQLFYRDGIFADLSDQNHRRESSNAKQIQNDKLKKKTTRPHLAILPPQCPLCPHPPSPPNPEHHLPELRYYTNTTKNIRQILMQSTV